MRCFAPLVGISEDPFTGSVLGGLTAYVDTFGFLPKGTHNFSVEQGHFVERPGVVKVEFSKNEECITQRFLRELCTAFRQKLIYKNKEN